LYKPGFEEEIIKGAKMYYNDEAFITNLNSKKHLVPFLNGVYDLLENKFRTTRKEDYVNLTVNYDYSETDNKEVYTFLEQVLPNLGVRDYVLKKMSECLNGDIPNTNFLMFIGDSGANGKSQLLNLMKLTMGEFGEKVEVTLLTRKRNNANEANSEKIKLMHKRFAFLSEPEDGEKINIGLLKELTGSEEIVARGLYQEAVSFVLEAKLFLACNELPEIKGEDAALWRRIRVIDFPSKFVDDPSGDSNEYKIDRTLPSRMREDLSWRQTFMKILLNYYFRDVKEPPEVQFKTNEYRQENNDFYNWLEENIGFNLGSILKLQDTIEIYVGKKIGTRQLGKYRKEMEKYIKEKYKNVDWEYKQFWIGDTKYKGWQNLQILEK
jgi:P4 family phage/plasmid primase-like protien